MPKFDQETFRNRIEHEDNLLNQRTGLFLTANGLGAVAVGVDPVADAVSLFLAVALIINLLWILCGLQNVLVLKDLRRSTFPKRTIEWTSWYVTALVGSPYHSIHLTFLACIFL